MMSIVSYEEALEWAKNWKAPECTDKNCICNIKKEEDKSSTGNEGVN